MRVLTHAFSERAAALSTRTLCFVGGIGFGVLGVAKAFSGRATDCRIYWVSGQRFLAAEPLYRLGDDFGAFKYSPISAAMFAPLGLFSERIGCMLWACISALLLTRALLIWTEQLASQRAHLLQALLALTTSFYLEAHLGQVDVFMLWALSEAWQQRQKRPIFSGALLAFLVLMKPPALVGAAAIWFFGERRARVVSGAAVMVAASAVICFARYGVDGTLRELVAWREMLGVTSPELVLHHDSQGLLTLVYAALHWGPPGAMSEVSVSIIALTALMLVLLWWLRRTPSLSVAVAILSVAALSPLCWRANCLLGLPLALILARQGPRFLWAMLLGAICALQLLLAEGVLSTSVNVAILLVRPYAWLQAALLVMGACLQDQKRDADGARFRS